MKSTVVLIALMFSHISWGSDDWGLGLPELERMESVDLTCSDEGVAYMIDLEGSRVWQSDIGSEEGIVIENVIIEKGDSPESYLVTGVLHMLGQSMNINLKINSKQAKLTISGKSEGEEMEMEKDLSCSSN